MSLSMHKKGNRKSSSIRNSRLQRATGRLVSPFVFVFKWQGQLPLPPKVSKMLPEQGPIVAATMCVWKEVGVGGVGERHTQVEWYMYIFKTHPKCVSTLFWNKVLVHCAAGGLSSSFSTSQPKPGYPLSVVISGCNPPPSIITACWRLRLKCHPPPTILDRHAATAVTQPG